MKTSKIASKIGLIMGSIFFIFNLYRLISQSPIFTPNDIPSLLFTFLISITSVYLFYILQKVLITIFEDQKTKNLILWVVRLESVLIIFFLYLLFVGLILYLKGVESFVEGFIENPNSIITVVSNLIFRVFIAIGVSLVLTFIYLFLGKKLLKLRKQENAFFYLGITFIIYGIINILVIIKVVENDFISLLMRSLSFVIMGFLFKKYEKYDLKDFDKLAYRTEKIFEKADKEKKKEKKIVKEMIKEENHNNNITKEDHSRFMPK